MEEAMRRRRGMPRGRGQHVRAVETREDVKTAPQVNAETEPEDVEMAAALVVLDTLVLQNGTVE